ncbi:MAG: sulfatase-like hydrolase/transferase [Rikenellaceae bacterium]
MNKIGVALLSGSMCLTTLSSMARGEDESKRPNVLIILTDDQGYADFGCFGSQTNKTPVMDRFAQEGMSFGNFYAQPVSGSSRSALLTGRYPIRSGGRSMHASEVTMAEYACDAGYQTVCIGKWDLSGRKTVKEQMPLAQGFDYYYGPLAANDRGSVTLYENDELVGKHTDMSSLLSLYTDKTIEFLREKRDDETPFFIYLSHTMMHVVIEPSECFKGVSEGGCMVMLSRSLTMRQDDFWRHWRS